MDIKLLERFYRGACSKEEAREVLSWFDAKSDKEKVLHHLQTCWQEFEEPKEVIPQHDPSVSTPGVSPNGYSTPGASTPGASTPDALLGNIHARLRKEGEMEVKRVAVKPINMNRSYFLRVAAIIILAFGLSFLMQKVIPAEHVPQISSFVIKEVPKGQKQIMMLSDGTKVTLNAGSRLSYPEAFSENKREVKLEGEAFFEVARDEQRPFTISSGDVCTTVLGTSFNVKAYKEEQDIRISVASGKVKVNRLGLADQTYHLSPGREAVYQLDKQSFTVQDFEKETLAWKEGILHFRDATFEEVKKALERWYGVDIQVVSRDDHQDWQYSGTFERQSLENVLLSIGYVKHFTYAMDGKQVKITFSNP